MIIFGSYITAKPEPNDVDVVLIFRDDFDITVCSEEVKKLLNHQQAEDEFASSIFWIRPSLLLLETLDEFSEIDVERAEMARQRAQDVLAANLPDLNRPRAERALARAKSPQGREQYIVDNSSAGALQKTRLKTAPTSLFVASTLYRQRNLIPLHNVLGMPISRRFYQFQRLWG